MFHVKHYCIGCPFMAIPEMSAVVLLPASSPPSWVLTVAFSGNFRDAQFCCEQDVQPRSCCFFVQLRIAKVNPILLLSTCSTSI